MAASQLARAATHGHGVSRPQLGPDWWRWHDLGMRGYVERRQARRPITFALSSMREYNAIGSVFEAIGITNRRPEGWNGNRT